MFELDATCLKILLTYLLTYLLTVYLSSTSVYDATHNGVEYLVTPVVITILKDTTTFQVLFIVSLFCAWDITTVEINSGVRLIKS